MNEELQSTNEELQTINDELRAAGRGAERRQRLPPVGPGQPRGGVAVVDRELRVLAWNPQAEELWGLREEEVEGKHLLNLDIGLPVERLRPLAPQLPGRRSREIRLLTQSIGGERPFVAR